MVLAMEVWSLNDWTASEGPQLMVFKSYFNPLIEVTLDDSIAGGHSETCVFQWPWCATREPSLQWYSFHSQTRLHTTGIGVLLCKPGFHPECMERVGCQAILSVIQVLRFGGGRGRAITPI